MLSAYRANLALLLAVFACSQGGSRRAGGEEQGAGTAPVTTTAADPRCEAVRPRVEALYQQAPAQGADPALSAQLVADDVAMVMSDCRREPDRVAPCAERAASTAVLEETCLIPLDEEGAADGDRLRGR